LGKYTYRQDQNAAQDSGHHDEQSTAKEDEKFDLFSPPKSGFEQHLKNICY